MAIKHEAVVARGDLLTSNMWNAAHIIEDMTIKGIHIDNLQIGTDHLIDGCVTTVKLSILDWLDLVNRLTDPTLAKGRLWFREDLIRLRFSHNGVGFKEIAWLADIKDHSEAVPLDHADLSVTTPKLADASVATPKLADLAVTAAKIADAAVTPVKLSFGTWQKIAEVVADVDVTTLTVTGLDLDAGKIYLLFFKTSNPTTAASIYYIFFNADSTLANYYTQTVFGYGTTVGAARANRPDFAYAPAGESCSTFAWVQRAPDGYVRLSLVTNRRTPASIEHVARSISWVTAANVTQIDITASQASGIGAGSKLIIFKLSA